MLEKLIEIYDKFSSVTITNQPKRMTVDGIRDWYVRVVWKVEGRAGNYECEWEGFENAEECLQDLVKAYEIGFPEVDI